MARKSIARIFSFSSGSSQKAQHKQETINDSSQLAQTDLPVFETLGGAVASIHMVQKAIETDSVSVVGSTISIDSESVASSITTKDDGSSSKETKAGSLDSPTSRSSSFSSRTVESWRAARGRRRVNSGRVFCKLEPLRPDASLCALAKAHAADLAASGRLEFPQSFDDDVDPSFVRVGVNACRGASSSRELQRLSMSTCPSDRANMMDPSFTHVGVYQATSSKGLTYLVQVFGEKR